MRITLALVLATPSPALAQATWLHYEDASVAGIGAAVRDVGDVNADGIGDLVVGSAAVDWSMFPPSMAAPSRVTWISGLDGTALSSFSSAAPDATGAAFDVVGDWNADGRTELVVGAPWSGGAWPLFDGAVRVHDGATGAVLAAIPPPTTGEMFGHSVAGLGDLDGDGIGDFAAAWSSGARVYSGASGSVLLTFLAPFGPAVTNLGRYGDFDGDGKHDVLVGFMSRSPNNSGLVQLYSSASGLLLASYSPPTPEPSFGLTLDSLDDIDGDGRRDLIIGAPQLHFDPSTVGPGYVAVYSATGALLRQVVGAQVDGHLGLAVAGGGDFDGDGVADYAAVSCCDLSATNCTRRAFVYSGATGAQLFSHASPMIGEASVSLDFVGDLNRDGRADLAFGSACWAPHLTCGDVTVLVAGSVGGPIAYCTSGTTSNQCVPALAATGAASASASSGFTLQAQGVEGQRQGLIFYGVNGRIALPWGASSSSLCVKQPTQRTPPQSSGGSALACNGSLTLDWLAFVANHAGALGAPFAAGDVVQAQAWFRDPPSPKTTQLTNALEFTLVP